jgi:DNA primase large subunit
MSQLIKIGAKDLIKYPFLTDSKEYLVGFSVESIGNDSELYPVFERAYKRIMAGIESSKYTESDNPIEEILSFFVALVILRLTNVSFFSKKFALSEAMRSEKYMEADLLKNPEMIYKILYDFFGVKMEKDGENYKIKIADYLVHAVNFKDLPWKLVNRRVDKGYVFLTRHECIRLLRNELQFRIQERIMKAPRVKNEPNFQDYVGRLIKKAEEFNVQPPDLIKDVPPCVLDAIATMENGENLSHSGRFMLASFYMTRGAEVDDIVQYFRKVPDFNERITKYQLQKIKDGEYKCPGCDKLNTQGLCRKTVDCGNIKNPLSFRKWNK